jgi:PTH1 family peptidyl-tRNA hydrolase
LGEWNAEEKKELPAKINSCIEIIQSFGTIGTERTMNFFNKR